VLTALPLSRRVTPAEARQLVEESVAGQLTVRPLSETDYLEAIELVARHGLSSGAVYDALHVVAALRLQCERIITYNVRHFQMFAPDHITVVTP
jgi:predicted nucleic acid-binding protein